MTHRTGFHKTWACWRSFVKNSYIEFYENPTNYLVTYVRSRTDKRQTDVRTDMIPT